MHEGGIIVKQQRTQKVKTKLLSQAILCKCDGREGNAVNMRGKKGRGTTCSRSKADAKSENSAIKKKWHDIASGTRIRRATNREKHRKLGDMGSEEQRCRKKSQTEILEQIMLDKISRACLGIAITARSISGWQTYYVRSISPRFWVDSEVLGKDLR